MKTDDFDYTLPDELIAQTPAIPRDSCRLFCLDCSNASYEHRVFYEIADLLGPRDLLVINNTRVLPARLLGSKTDTGGAVEVLLLKEDAFAPLPDTWECLVRPAKRIREGQAITFGECGLRGEVVRVGPAGERSIHFSADGGSVSEAFHRVGQTPLPPYITSRLHDPELYQTVFAQEERSAAAPTAGLHFTEELLGRLRDKGVGIVEVELQVGLDTFRTVDVEDPHDYVIHKERCRVSAEVAARINEHKAAGGRVIAVGTTSVRTLESAFDASLGKVVPYDDETSLFILPGYRFGIADAIITNFHVPRSSLMMLVSAFAGRETIMDAYQTAIDEGYRMLSFGDAMFIHKGA